VDNLDVRLCCPRCTTPGAPKTGRAGENSLERPQETFDVIGMLAPVESALKRNARDRSGAARGGFISRS
jgi:hypothetical protein